MGGNVAKEKKHLLNSTTNTIRKKLSSEDIKNFSTSLTKNDKFGSYSNLSDNYATFPSSQLHKTIQDLLSSSSSQFPNIVNVEEIERELDMNCPLEAVEQLDFCMLCHETDHMEAVELQKQLCCKYKLVGRVLWDCIPLGQDVFSGFEDLLNNSTKVLFYLTERYDDADACAHVARNLLMGQSNEGTSGKVIPIVNDFNTPIPQTFLLVDKLYLCSKLQFQYRFPAVFNVDVKNEKTIRSKKWRQAVDEKRKLILQNLILQRLSCI